MVDDVPDVLFMFAILIDFHDDVCKYFESLLIVFGVKLDLCPEELLMEADMQSVDDGDLSLFGLL